MLYKLMQTCLDFVSPPTSTVSLIYGSTCTTACTLPSCSEEPEVHTMLKLWTAAVVLLCVVKGNEVCYGTLGCFSDKPPWFGLPMSPDEINTRFLLHTRDTLANSQVITARNLSTITTSSFSPNKKTRFIIHGYIDEENYNWATTMCLNMFLVEDVNCIRVTWSKGSEEFYPSFQAINNIRVVGAEVAVLLQSLMENFNCSLSNIHVIGHGLGAHAAGEAGRRVPGISRISGLDPVGLEFEDAPAEMRLDTSDALTVDVIHTSSIPSIKYFIYVSGVGMYSSIGHIDFYPNLKNGIPGCEDTLENGPNDVCKHFRSVYYYSASIISPDGFLGYPCRQNKLFPYECFPCPKGGCPMMGHYADAYAGITKENQEFQLHTGSEEPFSEWLYKISVNFDKNDKNFLFFLVLYRVNGTTVECTIRYLTASERYICFKFSKEHLGTIYKVTLRWNYVDYRIPSTFGPDSVTVRYGNDSHDSRFCSSEKVGFDVLLTLTPC